MKSLLADTKLASRSEDGDTLRDRLQNLWTRLQDVKDLIVDADGNIAVAKEQGKEVKGDVAKVKVVIQEARTALKVSQLGILIQSSPKMENVRNSVGRQLYRVSIHNGKTSRSR